MKEEVIEYRIQKLEEAVVKLSGLADVVTRWDERFTQQGGMLQCSVHALRMGGIEDKLAEITKIVTDRTRAVIMVDEHEDKIKELQAEAKLMRSYIHKGIGAFIAVSLLFQIAEPWITDFIRKHI